MQVKCPYCNHSVNSAIICETCGENIRWVEKIYEKSELYYIKAYECAESRYLSEAVEYLEKAIYFNKYNIQAKNLLGLIYLEMGEVASALKLWILSDALCKEDNVAVEYMEKLQKEPKQLEAYKDSLMLYNRALRYVHKKDDDVAVIRLKKAINLNPSFLEARNLLAFCYLLQKQENKALAQVLYVLKKDRSNKKALSYLREIESKNVVIEDEESKKTISAPHINDIDISTDVMPQKFINRGGLFSRYAMYFVFGAVCMFGIGIGLIVPSKTASLEKKVYDMTSENTSLKVEFDTFVEEATQKALALESNNQKLAEENELLKQQHNKVSQENKLAKAKAYKEEGKWIESAEILNNIAAQDLSEENQKVYQSLKETVYPKAGDRLYDLGNNLFKQGNNVEAMLNFEKVLIFAPGIRTAAQALYNMGQIEEKNNNKTKALQFYNIILEDYKDTNAYYKAKDRAEKLK
ncbi:tetratricopeptide repeat protein [Niameybacter massiliensis]|uniref:Tetratricopeptide repeat protein n=1 Tax=Holtiella tumoricola TaxID=3018743 RepID=A0AA42DRB6_9FIRM|nr:tetratricopeptide repeat protein [Holtiella tumoricola]MDA3733853.1 tetratricopeptide repeat protein [Holtiella tumoricola]